MLGLDQPINLRLLDIPSMVGALEGVRMELVDGAYPLLREITCTADYAVAFESADVALLIGAKPRGPGMDRAQLLKANAQIFAGQGAALDQYARRNVKVLVVGNPANTNALIAQRNAPSLPKSCFHAMTRLDHNRAVGQIAAKLGVPCDRVKNITIWGNHSNSMVPDLSNAVVTHYPHPGSILPVRAAINDDAWIEGEFTKTVALRGGAIITARGKSSAASAAQAAVHHVRDWVIGTPKGEWVAMSVPSDGSYGVPEGIVFSFPCRSAHGVYEIVQGLQVDEATKAKIAFNVKELEEEKAQAGY